MTDTKTRAKKKSSGRKTAEKAAQKKAAQKKASQKKSAGKAEEVHPKISERRSGVEKEKSRRRSQTVFTLGFISMVAVIALAVLESPLFNVAEVKATGQVRVSAEEIVGASGIVLGSQLSDIDTSLTEQAVVDSSPWIKSAEVDRSWNGVVTIFVVERTPVLAVSSRALPDTVMLVDETGRQLISVNEIPPDVLGVSGLTVNGRPGQPSPVEVLRAAAIVEGMSDPVRAMTTGIEIGDGLVSLIIEGDAKITIGDQTLLEDKMIAIETLFARVDMRCLHEIDVRVPAAPTLTRQTRDGQPRAIVEDLGQCL